MEEKQLISLIKEFGKEINKTPTISEFSNKYNLHPSSIIRQFGSWNILVSKAGFNVNKSSRRTDEQLLLWLKAHPKARYIDIPPGIRSGLEERFNSISNARYIAGLQVYDWRSIKKKSKNQRKAKSGRPIQFTKEIIVDGLRKLAFKLGKPPRMKDVSKSSCGFPISAILSRFGTFNTALQASDLPPCYSYQEFKKLIRELQILIMNIKISINDIPKYYNLENDGVKSTFIYDNKLEEVKLTRSDICNSISSLLKLKEKCNKVIVYYLVDDSLYENSSIDIVCIMDIIDSLSDSVIKNKIMSLRTKYDEINRKYIWNNSSIKNLTQEERKF